MSLIRTWITTVQMSWRLLRPLQNPLSMSMTHIKTVIVGGIVFISGASALIYEVLWLKEAAFIFGSTAQAAGITFAAFFSGLAAGGWFFGNRISKTEFPLRCYAALEIGIMLCALTYFFLQPFYFNTMGTLLSAWDNPFVLSCLRVLCAFILVFPAAFFMGGTFPAVSQHVVRKSEMLGHSGSWLYAMNTLGAGCGAYVAGFHLPILMGFRNAYLVGVALTFIASMVAWSLSEKVSPELPVSERPPLGKEKAKLSAKNKSPLGPHLSLTNLYALALLSGFCTLGMEVLWTRLVVQFCVSSVYLFAAIIFVFLIATAIGSGIACVFNRTAFDPNLILMIILSVSGILIAFSPSVFFFACPLAGKLSSPMLSLLFLSICTLALPVMAMGILFPYLLRVADVYTQRAGKMVGHLLAVNTFGAVAGSLLAGFIFLSLFGLQRSIQGMALLYGIAAILIPQAKGHAFVLRLVPVMAIVFIGMMPGNLYVRFFMGSESRIVEVLDGASGTLIVTREENDYTLWLNSHYSLGSTSARNTQKLQTAVPLCIHPSPKSVYFIGMGTGISAGEALGSAYKDITRIVVTEIIPEVLKAAKKYIYASEWVNHLYTDPRAKIIVADGRTYLRGTRERFDVIIADLFVPWKAGTGSLYTREHFCSVLEHLNANGLFAQCLPMYQMAERDFGSVIHTMLDVFPLVTLWRISFDPVRPVLIAIGHTQKEELLPAPSFDLKESVVNTKAEYSSRIEFPLSKGGIPFLYCGNLTKASPLFSSYPINTLDKPVIEYTLSWNSVYKHHSNWLTGKKCVELFDRIRRANCLEDDPYFSKRAQADRQLATAGLEVFRTRQFLKDGQYRNAENTWAALLQNLR